MVVTLRFIKETACLLVILLVFINLVSHVGADSDGEITLKEAVDIGLQRAKEWNENAILTSVNSVDETMGGSRGETGKRFKWFLIFIVPSTDDYALIGISEKKITVFRTSK